jgi:tetrahydromethanopterin S-methyltransferase subunit B
MTIDDLISKIKEMEQAKEMLLEAINHKNSNPDSFDARNMVSELYLKIAIIKESIKLIIDEL